VVLLAVAGIAAIAMLAHGASAGTTRIDGNLTITNDTVLANGTWYIAGWLRVRDVVLTLDHVELVVESQDFMGLWVDQGGAIKARDSAIRGVGYGLHIYNQGSCAFFNCTLSRLSMEQASGPIVIDRSTIEGAWVDSNSDLLIRDCAFRDGASVRWGWSTYTDLYARAVIATSVFDGNATGKGGVTLDGSGVEWTAVNVTLSGCTFNGIACPIKVDSFEDWGTLEIEDNVVMPGSGGSKLLRTGHSVGLQGNIWRGDDNSSALMLTVAGNGAPSIADDAFVGGWAGLSITGIYQRMEVRRINVTGCPVGIECRNIRLDIYDSSIEASVVDFTLNERGFVHVRGCGHSHRASVTGALGGEVSEYRTVEIESVTWQEGTAILSGSITFLSKTGIALGFMDLPAPGLVELTSWYVTEDYNVTPLTARGRLEVDWRTTFYADPFYIDSTHPRRVVFRDDNPPYLTVYEPREGDLIGGTSVFVHGWAEDRGIGFQNVTVRIDGTVVVVTDIEPDGQWNVTIDPVMDGTYNVTVEASDRAGNVGQVLIADVTTDGTAPFIDVLQPRPWVNYDTVRLLGRTEVGATVTINDTAVPVNSGGYFERWLTLVVGPNLLRIQAVDKVGNVVLIVHTIELDVQPPMLQVTQPANNTWTWGTLIIVRGNAEADADVTVNGVPASRDRVSFTATVGAEEGRFTIRVVAIDRALNALTVYIIVNIDQTAPAIGVDMPADGCMTREPRILVAGSVRDTGPLELTVDGARVDVVGLSWLAWVDLVSGWNVLEVEAEDAAGNHARRVLRVLLDDAPPVVNVTLQVGPDTWVDTAGGTWTGRGNATLVLEASEPCTVLVTGRDAMDVPQGRTTVVVDLRPGRNDITVAATDEVGNAGATTRLTINRDSTPPSLMVIEPLDGRVARDSWATVRGITEPGATVTVNGLAATVLSDGQFTARMHLIVGTNAITVVASDRFGNAANATVRVEREGGAGAGGAGIGTGTAMAAGALIAVLAVLVLLVARTRGRVRPAAPRGGGDARPNGTPETPGGVGVRVRRGR